MSVWTLALHPLTDWRRDQYLTTCSTIGKTLPDEWTDATSRHCIATKQPCIPLPEHWSWQLFTASQQCQTDSMIHWILEPLNQTSYWRGSWTKKQKILKVLSRPSNHLWTARQSQHFEPMITDAPWPAAFLQHFLVMFWISSISQLFNFFTPEAEPLKKGLQTLTLIPCRMEVRPRSQCNSSKMTKSWTKTSMVTLQNELRGFHLEHYQEDLADKEKMMEAHPWVWQR